MKTVVDTNIWISALPGGRSALPVLQAWRENKFRLIVSQPLIDEFDEVRQRSRLKKYINPDHAEILLKQLYQRGEMVKAISFPNWRNRLPKQIVTESPDRAIQSFFCAKPKYKISKFFTNNP